MSIAGIANGGTGRASGGDTMRRYGASVLGPAAVSAAHFLVSLILLHAMPAGEFGLFSFVLVVAGFGISVNVALISVPLARGLATGDHAILPACFQMNWLVCGAIALLSFGALLGSGAQLRADTEATAVWTYRNGLLDLHCAKGGDCELTAWDTKGNARWRVGTGGIGFVLDAANPDLPDTNPIGADGIDDNVAGPREMPDLIGLPDGHSVRVIDTAGGKLVQTAQTGNDQRIAVAGGRVLTVTGTSADGTCYYGVVATDPPGNGVVWKRDGLNLRTAANGSSCKQDRDPAGGEDVVLGVDPIGRQELIAAHDGRVLWHGVKGEQVLAVNDGFAVIRSADQATLRGFSMATGRTTWRRPAAAGTSAALTPYAVIIVTSKPARVTAVSPTDGRVRAEVRTSAKIFATGPHGMIAVDGRDMAYLPFA